jgi:hypothetical protein
MRKTTSKPRIRICPLLAVGILLTAAAACPAQEWQNIRLNQDLTTQLQNEEQIAINPVVPQNRVAVWRDFRLGYRQVGWGYTTDGGATWTEGGLFVEPNYPWQSDPGVTTDALGNFYAVILSYTSTSEENGLYVYRSTDGGVSWGPPHEVINQYPGVFEDKELIACDRTGGIYDGNLYVVWARFGYDIDIVLRRSTDAGVSWGPTVTVSDQSSVQYPIPVVGSQGELYVAWTSYMQSSILIDVSHDGGQSFGTDRTAANVYTPSTILNGNVNAYSSPHMDADLTGGPYAGRLYLAFMDRRQGLPDYDIWVTYSDDEAASWSTPARINDDAPGNGRDQFLPWLTVDNQGVVSVVFLDRRDDPQNRLYHCYLAQSFDGGGSWEPNVRVSTEPSDPVYAAARSDPGAAEAAPPQPLPGPLRAGLLGEYIGVVSWNGVPTPVWTDIRNHNQDVYAGYWPGVSSAPLARSGDLTLRISPSVIRCGEAAALRISAGEAPGLPAARLPALIYDATGRLRGRLPAIRTEGGNWHLLPGRGLPREAGVYVLRLGEARAAGRLTIIP